MKEIFIYTSFGDILFILCFVYYQYLYDKPRVSNAPEKIMRVASDTLKVVLTVLICGCGLG